MRILVCNDDGIQAKGIIAIAKAMANIGHDVTVIAPDNECSGWSHKLSLIEPIAVKQIDAIEGCKCYKIHGTPADCAKFGVGVIMNERPDLLISGINNGSNVGTDLIYSGTVNAAIEGALNGIKSIALSMRGGNNNYEYACEFFIKNFDTILSMMYDYHTAININFPSDTASGNLGYVITKVGERRFHDDYTVMPSCVEGFDKSYLLTGTPIKPIEHTAECDVTAWEHGLIVISPIKVDFNDYDRLDMIRGTLLCM